MKYGFLDQHAGLDSPIHRLDPRAKLLFFFGAALVVASEPAGEVAAFPYYAALILGLAWASRVPLLYLAARWAAAAPFVVLAALLPWVAAALGAEPVDSPENFAASIVLRAWGAITLLILLTAATHFARLLWAMRKLRAPASLSVIVTLMYRYVFILLDEWRRISQARDCRSAGVLRGSKASFYAKQIAMVFLRGWERAERVHWAMAVRGFRGWFPLLDAPRFRPADLGFLVLGLASFLAVRVWL